MSVIVRLLQYNGYEVSLDKSRLHELFPTSFLATTLDIDPTTEVIEIPSRDVTPNMLNIVKMMLDTDRVVLYNPNIPKDEYIRASNYLNIDILTAMADPNYNLFVQSHPFLNLLHLVAEDYEDILAFSATSNNYLASNGYEGFLSSEIKSPNGNQLIWYLFRIFPSDTEDIDNRMLVVSSYSGSLDIVRLLLRRSWVNPATARVSGDYHTYMRIGLDIIYPYINILRQSLNQALYFAIVQNHVNVVELLLQDRRVGYETNEEHDASLLYSILGDIHNYALFNILVQNERFNRNAIVTDLLYNPVKLAIALPYIDTTNYYYFWIINNQDQNQSLKVYLTNPKLDLMKAMQYLYREDQFESDTSTSEMIEELGQIDYDKFKIIESDPRFDPNLLPQLFYRVAEFYKQRDVLEDILANLKLTRDNRVYVADLLSRII